MSKERQEAKEIIADYIRALQVEPEELGFLGFGKKKKDPKQKPESPSKGSDGYDPDESKRTSSSNIRYGFTEKDHPRDEDGKFAKAAKATSGGLLDAHGIDDSKNVKEANKYYDKADSLLESAERMEEMLSQEAFIAVAHPQTVKAMKKSAAQSRIKADELRKKGDAVLNTPIQHTKTSNKGVAGRILKGIQKATLPGS